MATYAIGDIQGCHETFLRLIERIGFDPAADRLWLVGDLVNRGPGSLAQLRWVVEHEAALTCVLGNHDLHLLATAQGLRKSKGKDTLDEVLAADDRSDLLAWLAARPLVHVEDDHVLVHAGLVPSWSVSEAVALAREAEQALVAGRLLPAMIKATAPRRWKSDLNGAARLAFIAGALTRLRTCSLAGEPCPDFAGPPDEAPKGCLPWFAIPGRKATTHTLVFGHWAALGLVNRKRVLALDTGCVWGRELTAVRLEDRAVFSQHLVDAVP